MRLSFNFVPNSLIILKMFPETPQTLLKKIADLANGDDAAVWLEFVELYTPPLRHFIHTVSGTLSESEAEETVQDVFVRLTDVLRAGGIDRRKGRFRDYLAATTRRLLIDRFRSERARLACLERQPQDGYGRSTLADADPGELVDAAWKVAARRAAIEHVLTQTAVSEQSKRIYRALAIEQRAMKEVAESFGVSYDVVKQVKSRLDRAVEGTEANMRI